MTRRSAGSTSFETLAEMIDTLAGRGERCRAGTVTSLGTCSGYAYSRTFPLEAVPTSHCILVSWNCHTPAWSSSSLSKTVLPSLPSPNEFKNVCGLPVDIHMRTYLGQDSLAPNSNNKLPVGGNGCGKLCLERKAQTLPFPSNTSRTRGRESGDVEGLPLTVARDRPGVAVDKENDHALVGGSIGGGNCSRPCWTRTE